LIDVEFQYLVLTFVSNASDLIFVVLDSLHYVHFQPVKKKKNEIFLFEKKQTIFYLFTYISYNRISVSVVCTFNLASVIISSCGVIRMEYKSCVTLKEKFN